MSIIGIILITFLISGLVFAIFGAISSETENSKLLIVGCIVGFLCWVGATFVGIGINTNSEKIYVKKYLAQKHTIEQSLKNENLTGLERIQLVNKATELNGEFAEKKAHFELWYFVVYDNTIYDGVELINLD